MCDAALIGWSCRRDSCTSASGSRSSRVSSWCPTRSSSLCANRLNQQLSKTKRQALQAACKLHNNYIHLPLSHYPPISFLVFQVAAFQKVSVTKFFIHLLGAFAKLRKVTISFVMSICPCVRMEQLGSHWADYQEILYLSIFRTSVKNMQA